MNYTSMTSGSLTRLLSVVIFHLLAASSLVRATYNSARFPLIQATLQLHSLVGQEINHSRNSLRYTYLGAAPQNGQVSSI